MYRPAADNPWVCPNDRQLALRAKLRSGWSVKTCSLQKMRRPQPLDEQEQHAIVNVIQKAETLEKKEQIRIGKLVDRLENMRRHAIGNGSSTCVLCGEKFGLLVGSKHKCRDCGKAVCHKCVVEITSGGHQWMLCKLCSESRELWKKSGAWFFKGMPRYVMPEARPRSQLGEGLRRRAVSATSTPTATTTEAHQHWSRHVQNHPNGSAVRPAASLWTLNCADSAPGQLSRAASPASLQPSVESSSDEDDDRPRSAVRRVTTYERVAPLVNR